MNNVLELQKLAQDADRKAHDMDSIWTVTTITTTFTLI